MRLETLTIRGLLAFADQQTLDLRDLPPGLIAIVGPNGAGKTTLVESAIAAFYRQLPSRGKELVDYAHDRDAYLEATIALEGRGLYRARVNLDGVRRQSEAVLEVIEPDGRRRPLTDGKVSTFDAAVADLLPPLPIVLASAFAAQNRAGSFIALDRKGRKDLFAELLGLSRYEVWATRARQAAASVEASRAAAIAVRDRLAQETGPEVEATLAARANRLQGEMGQLTLRQRAIQATLDAIGRDREAYQVAAARYAAARTTADRLQVELAVQEQTMRRLDAQRAQLEADAQRDRARLAERLRTAEARLDDDVREVEQAWARDRARAEEQAASARAALEARIAEHRRLLAEAATSRAAVAALEDRERRLIDVQAALAEADRRVRELLGQRDQLQGERRTLEAVERELARARRDAAQLAQVPCHGAPAYAGCPFLADALGARDRVAALEQAVAPLPTLQADEARISRALAAAEDARRAADATRVDLERELADLRRQAAQASRIDVAEQRLADDERQLAEVEAALAERCRELDAQRDRARAAIEARRVAARLDAERAGAELETTLAERLEALRHEQQALAQAIAGARQDLAAAEAILAETGEAHARLEALDREQETQQRAWAATEADRGRLEAEAVALHRDWAALGERRRERDATTQQLAALEQDLVEWQLLARIFSRDGLPVLEIDAAGPAVSAYTNELLQSCFGPRFTVELITQTAKVSGKGLKEVFELRVFDGERGGEPRDLTDLSGGEQILVDECLKSAIAVYVNEHGGTPIRTLIRDETTGALDGENIGRYVAMLRRLQDLGGFHHVLFVTHHPEASAMADAQVVVEDGTIRLVLPPYAEAA